jgi:hypothetical protein
LHQSLHSSAVPTSVSRECYAYREKRTLYLPREQHAIWLATVLVKTKWIDHRSGDLRSLP